MKNKSLNIANMPKYGYSSLALSKISKLALVGYLFSTGVQPTFYSGFFVRNISMRSHVMAKLERDIFICAGHLLSLSTNPFQLCHLNYLVVIGKAPLNQQERINHA